VERYLRRSSLVLAGCVLVIAASLAFDFLFPHVYPLPSGLTAPRLIGLTAGIMTVAGVLAVFTHGLLARRRKPPVEGAMIARLYWLVAFLVTLLVVAYGYGILGRFGTLFSLFGGMLFGWSLQAPVSGLAAWALVSLKRPYRPGDRIQLPNLNLTGDVKEIGVMYMVLNQVGGSIGSEEAVGRAILVPNAMLFNQVVINYTVAQEAPFMLDEIVVRITYDSDWDTAERILLDAATTITQDVIETTGTKPYIRSDLYDYGVYLRLRYQTQVKQRVETAYKIHKLIFREIQRTPCVDIAIPYVYSYRAGQQDKKENGRAANGWREHIRKIDVWRIRNRRSVDPGEIAELARCIDTEGLLQPIVVAEIPTTGTYEILAGHRHFEACKTLGWKSVPSLVRRG
jgi:small-conductance mechanosensitive channel